MEKPAVVTEAMLVYLDGLGESGVTNMFGARPYVAEAFGLNRADSAAVLSYWMATFSERHPTK